MLFRSGQTIKIETIGTNPQPLEQIIFIMTNMDGGEEWNVPANEIGTVISSTTSSIEIQYTYTGVGATRFLRAWRYIDASDVPLRKIELATFELENIDKMRMAILSAAFISPDTAFEVTSQNLEPYDFINKTNIEGLRAIMGSQEGLAIKTYQSDMLKERKSVV